MTKILLSFCIPTYNRPKRIDLFLQQFTSLESDEIEIVIGDDNPNSNKTEQIIEKYDDSRIIYFKNNLNYGLDANMLKIIHRAKGEYVFLNMDDDDIAFSQVTWVLGIIKKYDNITQIRGSIGNRRINDDDVYYKFDDVILKKGTESLLKLAFLFAHGSGIILKKNSIDLNKAKKRVGSLFLQEHLMTQAMLKGETLLTSKNLAYVGEVIYDSEHPALFKKRKHAHPVGGVAITRFRIHTILDLLEGEIREKLFKKEIENLYFWLFRTLFNPFKYFESIKAFLEGIVIVLTIKKVRSSLRFWLILIRELFFKIVKSPRFRR